MDYKITVICEKTNKQKQQQKKPTVDENKSRLQPNQIYNMHIDIQILVDRG